MKNKIFLQDGNYYRIRSSFADIVNAVMLKSNMRAKMNERIRQFNISAIKILSHAK
jgi:hypothetical protein